MDVVIGKGSSLNDNVRVIRSVIGKNCVIEKDIEIQDSFIFDNCIIKVGETFLVKYEHLYCNILFKIKRKYILKMPD